MAESFELTEKPGSDRERVVGLIISVIAVALAIVSSGAHEAQNEQIVENVKSADKYALYESRKDRGLQYLLAIDATKRINQLQDQLDQVQKSQLRDEVEFKHLVVGKPDEVHPDKTALPTAPEDIDLPEPPRGEDPNMAKYQDKLTHENTEQDQDLKEADDLAAGAKKIAKKAGILDIAEIALQVSIVMCSITVLTEIMLFVRLGVVSAVVGVIIALYATFFLAT